MRGERVKVRESCTLVRKRGGGSEWEHWKEKVDSTLKEGRLQGGEGGQAKRSFLGEVGERMSG